MVWSTMIFLGGSTLTWFTRRTLWRFVIPLRRSDVGKDRVWGFLLMKHVDGDEPLPDVFNHYALEAEHQGTVMGAETTLDVVFSQHAVFGIPKLVREIHGVSTSSRRPASATSTSFFARLVSVRAILSRCSLTPAPTTICLSSLGCSVSISTPASRGLPARRPTAQRSASAPSTSATIACARHTATLRLSSSVRSSSDSQRGEAGGRSRGMRRESSGIVGNVELAHEGA